MESFSGQFEYVDAQGARAGAGPCEVTFDQETLAIAPARGSALVFDLGDIDSLESADYQLTIRLYTGAVAVLRALGKAFQSADRDLRLARRDRFVTCLLLADLDECARFEAVAQWSVGESRFSGPAEIRLYETNIAVLPDASAGIQWRIADVDDVRFDGAQYSIELRSGSDTLTVSKLARRTEEFRQRVQETMAEVAARSGRALLTMFPFLSPDQLAHVTAIMKEGRTTAMADLAAVDKRIEAALLDRAAGKAHRAYLDALLKRAVPGSLRIGYKLLDPDHPIEAEEDVPDAAAEGDPAPVSPAAGPRDDSSRDETPDVAWLFAQLAGCGAPGRTPLVAWEPITGSGRATYVFRLAAAGGSQGAEAAGPSSAEAEIERLNRGLLSVNFRREPIYLDDGALARMPQYRRYLIAARRLPDVRRLRTAFAGRAIHTSLDRWQADLDAIVGGN